MTALPQGFTHDLADLLVAIKEHVLLAGEVIEHRHPTDFGGCRDLVHRHLIETPLEKEKRGGIGNSLARGYPSPRASICWR
jgi:hypothetical protein